MVWHIPCEMHAGPLSYILFDSPWTTMLFGIVAKRINNHLTLNRLWDLLSSLPATEEAQGPASALHCALAEPSVN